MVDHLQSDLTCQYWYATLPLLRAIRAGTLMARAEYWAARSATRSAGDVAVIPIVGTITQRQGWYGSSIDGTRTALRAALADGSRGIVLLFDTPGGEVYGVDELASEIRAARGGAKPIVSSLDPLAASAGFYLASQADEVMITPSGEGGSIGVYGEHQDWSGALDQMGVKVTLVSAGEGKTAGNPYEALSDPARADMQAGVDRYYGMFAAAVSKGRGVPVDTVRAQWQAKVYGAKEAVAIGMADSIGTVDDAIRRAGALAQARRATAASIDHDVETRRRTRERSALTN